ncbi:MAG: signal peptide peptidase SppA, partial [Myxococcaceae bacterium]
MDRRAAWVIGTVFGGLFLCLFGFLFLLFIAVRSGGSGETEDSGGGDRVGVIEVIGQIGDAKKFLKELKQFSDDDHIKAVVVRIDSPGGAVGPSQEMYQAVKKLRAKKKVVASMGSIAASGGFYLAAAAEKVYANPGTLTGSIGVIFQLPNVSGVMKWAGVQMNVITAGKMKDAGSPFREMTDDERAYFQGVLKDVHEQFIGDVADGRGMKADDLRPLADGRVFSGRQAK